MTIQEDIQENSLVSGQIIEGKVVAQLEKTTYLIELPENYKHFVAIYYNHENQNVSINSSYTFQIYNIQNDKFIYLTSISYGHSHVSIQSLTSLLSSVRTIRELLMNPVASEEILLIEKLSVFMLFCKSVIKKNREDWIDIENLMGKPDKDYITTVYKYLDYFRRYSYLDQPEQFIKKIENFKQDHGIDFFNRIESNIIEAIPKLQNTNLSLRAYKDVAIKKKTPENNFILAESTKRKHQEANKTHKEILLMLTRFLEKLGYIVEHGLYIDLFATLTSGAAVFEVKSITQENELSQCRKGLSQLYEYRYRHNIPTASMWLVLSQKPYEEWLIDYLVRDRLIHVIWLENEKFVGSNMKLLLP